jgi:hypothetical protein
LKSSFSQVPFIYEVPNESWTSLSSFSKHRLMDMGMFYSKRMKYMNTVYCLYQSNVGVQVSVCNTLDIPHGQFVGSNLPTSCVKIVLLHPKIVPNSTYILHSKDPVKSVVYPDRDFALPWIDILEHVQSQSSKTRSVNSIKRQESFVDYGFCGGEGHTPNGVDAGLSAPSPLSGSLDEFSFFKNLATNLTAIIEKENLNIWKQMPMERRQKFSERLGLRCAFEFCRLAVTDVKPGNHSEEGATCGLHCDEKNCPVHSGVLIFSKIVDRGTETKRVSIIMCQRKACNDYMRRATNSYGPALSFVMKKFDEIPVER